MALAEQSHTQARPSLPTGCPASPDRVTR
jgi:hypothetical protein